MRISELSNKKTTFSFEIFPPKRTAPIDTVYTMLDEVKDIKPDFISVTYGAGGSENSKLTFEIASAIKNNYGIESIAHMPCIGLKKHEVLALLDDLKSKNIENILALRGDMPADGDIPKGDFDHANELITFIKENGDFDIAAACYPEKHPEAADVVTDIRNLKRKVDSGADYLLSQLFFDNNYFYRFRERCTLAGIDVPIEAGIMPVVNKRQIERMVSLCGASLPEKFATMMMRYEDNPEAIRDAGIAYAVNQIIDLISNGVDGIHLYIMNNAYVAKKIYEAFFRLL
ncbi:MAG: methylenetetrahydrofolate reductase [NAD(P)H] [Firmicutes bacterium]|nr:methylenetetrahydrofolate reductase [NAD(P)H] [Bacillota bacterium]